jgi:hypothetical protein
VFRRFFFAFAAVDVTVGSLRLALGAVVRAELECRWLWPCGIVRAGMGGYSESIAALRRVLGVTSPPSTIAQEAFDHDAGHLHRLVQLKAGEPATQEDLWDYSQDLRYTEIQGELLEYLLPVCLQAWHDDLRGARDYGGFVEHFYPVLADRHVFDTLLTPKQTGAVSEFMRESILAEIDDQRGLEYSGSRARPYRWMLALTTYGVMLPDLNFLWASWWDLGTKGRARIIGAVHFSPDVPERGQSGLCSVDSRRRRRSPLSVGIQRASLLTSVARTEHQLPPTNAGRAGGD